MQENGAEPLVACTGCQGCMPCMVKINIPLLFELYNRTESEGIEAVRAEYESQEKRADDCINCYRCEKQCPQHLGKLARTYRHESDDQHQKQLPQTDVEHPAPQSQLHR